MTGICSICGEPEEVTGTDGAGELTYKPHKHRSQSTRRDVITNKDITTKNGYILFEPVIALNEKTKAIEIISYDWHENRGVIVDYCKDYKRELKKEIAEVKASSKTEFHDRFIDMKVDKKWWIIQLEKEVYRVDAIMRLAWQHDWAPDE